MGRKYKQLPNGNIALPDDEMALRHVFVKADAGRGPSGPIYRLRARTEDNGGATVFLDSLPGEVAASNSPLPPAGPANRYHRMEPAEAKLLGEQLLKAAEIAERNAKPD